MAVCILPCTVADAGFQPERTNRTVDNPSTTRKNRAQQRKKLDVCGPGIFEQQNRDSLQT